jgi:PAS domain S-box-containing protein
MSNESVERQLAETSEQTRRLHHANRLYAVLSAVNRAITRKPGLQELIEEICRILVETGEFRMVWFGGPDPEGWVTPVATFGDTLGYLATIRISVHDIPEGRGPTGSALRENHPVICNNIPTNPAMFPWRDQAAHNGFNSSASFPVLLPTGVIACLTLYSTESDFFSNDEELLLREICTDIGYALEFIAAEVRRIDAEARLEQERTLLKTLVGTIPDLIWLKDLDGIYLSCNPAFERFFGALEKEIVGKTDYDFVSAKLADFFRARDLEAMSAGHPSKNEEWVTFADDGHSALLETIKAPMFSTTGELVGVLGIARDITAMRLSEQALREREERHRSIIQTTLDGFWLVDKEGFLREVNNAYCRMSGYSLQELLTMRITDLEAAESGEATDYHIQKITRQGQDRFESRHRRKDGSTFDVEVSVQYQPVSAGQFVAFIRDITLRKMAETDLLQAKDAAEAANQAKSRFLANISHELRTPLNGVLGMIQITQFGTLDEKQRGYLAMALTSGFGLVRILDDILDLSKIEAKTIVLESKPFSLRDCVSDTATLLLPEAVRKGLKLTVSLADQLPENINGDPVRLRQVLSNLIGNAVKFTTKGTVEVRVAPGAGGITFTITDTGIGIPMKKRQLLFRPFSQVDDSNTRQYGGLGLGLVISRELVELMGGTLTCDSTEGVGSSFSFTIPFQLPDIVTTQVPTHSHPTFNTDTTPVIHQERAARVLVVEDDATNRALIHLALRRQKIDADTAIHGRDALEKWANNQYDLIIMDIQMPVMDGITATRAIREQERVHGGHIPILALTAHAYRTDREWCLNAGMDDYLSKPVDLNELIETVRRLLASEKEAVR